MPFLRDFLGHTVMRVMTIVLVGTILTVFVLTLATSASENTIALVSWSGTLFALLYGGAMVFMYERRRSKK